MERQISIIMIVATILPIIACSEVTKNSAYNEASEKASIEQVINNNIGWAKNKDFSLLYSTIANDSGYLAVHPEGNVVRGIADFKKAEEKWGSPDFKAIRYGIRDLDIHISKSGDAAWWYCLLDDVNEWKGQPACWMNTHWTGVLEKREGRWIIVQMHFSFSNNK